MNTTCVVVVCVWVLCMYCSTRNMETVICGQEVEATDVQLDSLLARWWRHVSKQGECVHRLDLRRFVVVHMSTADLDSVEQHNLSVPTSDGPSSFHFRYLLHSTWLSECQLTWMEHAWKMDCENVCSWATHGNMQQCPQGGAVSRHILFEND